MLRIIRIAGDRITFFAQPGFVVTPHGDDDGGSGRGSDTAVHSGSGNSPGRYGESRHVSGTAVSGNPGSRGYPVLCGMYRDTIIKKW